VRFVNAIYETGHYRAKESQQYKLTVLHDGTYPFYFVDDAAAVAAAASCCFALRSAAAFFRMSIADAESNPLAAVGFACNVSSALDYLAAICPSVAPLLFAEADPSSTARLITMVLNRFDGSSNTLIGVRVSIRPSKLSVRHTTSISQA
jgi:hypothetical protein